MTQSQKLSNSEEICRLVAEKVKTEYTKYASPKECQDDLDVTEDCQFSSQEVTESLNRNEDGDAWLYIEIHRGRFCYDTAARCWYKWSDHYWKEDFLNDALRNIREVIEIYGYELDRLSIELRKEIKSE